MLPVNGSREALFALAQTVIDPTRPAVVVCPNPFYQIYEGAALLGGARPYYMNALPANGFRPTWSDVPEEIWKRTRLVYACSPSNPIGRVMDLDDPVQRVHVVLVVHTRDEVAALRAGELEVVGLGVRGHDLVLAGQLERVGEVEGSRATGSGRSCQYPIKR